MKVIVKSRYLEYRIKGMNSMKFIKKQLFPKQKTVIYERFVEDIRPQKYEPRIMRLTSGGNILYYGGKSSI